ncbi:hypothetical protein [Streptococcus equi]
MGNDNEYLFFNHEDIADVIYFGYVNSMNSFCRSLR